MAAGYHAQVKGAIDRGDLVIACMGKGNWTSSGHYVLVWKIEGGTIYINAPASTITRRTRGSYSLFKQQVKYYWVIKAPVGQKEVEEDMTEKEVLAIIDGLSDEAAYKLLEKAMRHTGKQPEPHWSQTEGQWAKAKEKGVTDGTRPKAPATRAEVVTMMARAGTF